MDKNIEKKEGEEVALSVRNVSKVFTLEENRSHSLKEEFTNFLHSFKSNGQVNRKKQSIKALNNVSFDIYKGDVVGIIGRNGAGKSTLLNILSEVTPPTTGRIEYNGVLTSILGVGTGFHPDLSGRDNVYLNGAILGMSRDRIQERIDDIIDFSDLQDFIDAPVKHYSNGMYLRLAFSIFAHLNTEILLLDEVLSVGDAAFRRKCTKLFSQITNTGGTIVLVSHNVSEVMQLCNRCIYLENGEVITEGKPKDVAESYLEETMEEYDDQGDDQNGAIKADKEEETQLYKRSWNGENAPSSHEFLLRNLSVKASGKTEHDEIVRSDPIEVTFEIEKLDNNNTLQLGFHLINLAKVWVLCDSHSFQKDKQQIAKEAGIYRLCTVIPSGLLNARLYSVSISVSKNQFDLIGFWERLLKFRIEIDEWEKGKPWVDNQAVLRPYLNWDIQKLSTG